MTAQIHLARRAIGRGSVSERVAQGDREHTPVGVVGSTTNVGTSALVDRWSQLGIDVALLSPEESLRSLGRGDVALSRLDVTPALDGVEPGLLALLLLDRRGVRVLNPVEGVLAAHDKRRTARLLQTLGLPHPRTRFVPPGGPVPSPPVVLKPRFGSWGRDVACCRSNAEVASYLDGVRDRQWYRRGGVLAQEVVPNAGRDLRVIVAGGRVVGAIERRAARGEWRTNLSCGGTAAPASVSDAAAELALTAAVLAPLDFVGVDLLPLGGERYVILELNAAVDFDAGYSLAGQDIYAVAATSLELLPRLRAVAAI
jgi:RimK family alpha-L-glutamate ligase